MTAYDALVECSCAVWRVPLVRCVACVVRMMLRVRLVVGVTFGRLRVPGARVGV